MIRGERGVEWCERSLLGGPLFIAARVPWGAARARPWRGVSGERKGKQRTGACRPCPGDAQGVAGAAKGGWDRSGACNVHHWARGIISSRAPATVQGRHGRSSSS
jgi:hypothetical protein